MFIGHVVRDASLRHVTAMNSNLLPFCLPGPSSKSNNDQIPTNGQSENIQYVPPYHYEMDAAQSSRSVAQQLQPPYPVAWPESQSYPSPYMAAMAVDATRPPPAAYVYPSTSGLTLPPAEQIPPSCLDWTINPVKAPPRQFKTTAEPLFTPGYSSTISENWMEGGDKELQYSIKNFTFSTKRTADNTNEAGQVCREYDSLLVSIPQVVAFLFDGGNNLSLKILGPFSIKFHPL